MLTHYFDHNATTPVASEVIDEVAATLRDCFGNASSVHRHGQRARQKIEAARRTIAAKLNASADDLVFTSGGTEANNLAVFGAVNGLLQTGSHVITTAIEHPAVLQPIRQLEHNGVAVTVVYPDCNGLIDPTAVEREIRPTTALISVMHANNEVGTIQPVEAIAALVRQVRSAGQRVYLHSDGIQAFGKIRVDVQELGVDLYSISAHKMYGPKGVGALYIRKGTPCEAVQLGGAQERKRRAGTENVPAIAGFARAVEMVSDSDPDVREYFERELTKACFDARVNGAVVPRLPNTSSVYFPGISGQTLVIALDMRGFAVSSGAACSSGSIEPSPVLLAMGRTAAEARASIRFSFGRSNTRSSVDELVVAIKEAVAHQRHGIAARPVLAHA